MQTDWYIREQVLSLSPCCMFPYDTVPTISLDTVMAFSVMFHMLSPWLALAQITFESVLAESVVP